MPELLDDVRCALCGANEASPVLRAVDHREGLPGEFAVVECDSCGLCRVHPWPANPLDWYPRDYQQHSAPSLTSRVVAALSRRAHAPGAGRFRRAAVSRVVPDAFLGGALDPGSRLLDVGAGNGAIVGALRAAGVDAWGIEPGGDAEAHTVDEVLVGDLRDNPLADERFDVVRLYHVLEHIPDPVDALERAAALLRPGGRIVVGVPNFASAGRRAFGASWDGLELPRHLHHFTHQTLERVARAADLRVVSSRTVALFGVLPGTLDARANGGARQSGWGNALPVRIAVYPLELALAGIGLGEGLMLVLRR